jgi:hypothetical protein
MELVESIIVESPDNPGKLVQVHLTKEEATFIMQTGLQALMIAGAVKLTNEKDGLNINELMDTKGNA